jgi:hypothetical protein
MKTTTFHRSSFCGANGCVEVAVRPEGSIELRDGKNPALPSHTFSVEEWDAFVAGVKVGEFDSAALISRLGQDRQH